MTSSGFEYAGGLGLQTCLTISAVAMKRATKPNMTYAVPKKAFGPKHDMVEMEKGFCAAECLDGIVRVDKDIVTRISLKRRVDDAIELVKSGKAECLIQTTTIFILQKLICCDGPGALRSEIWNSLVIGCLRPR